MTVPTGYTIVILGKYTNYNKVCVGTSGNNMSKPAPVNKTGVYLSARCQNKPYQFIT